MKKLKILLMIYQKGAQFNQCDDEFSFKICQAGIGTRSREEMLELQD